MVGTATPRPTYSAGDAVDENRITLVEPSVSPYGQNAVDENKITLIEPSVSPFPAATPTTYRVVEVAQGDYLSVRVGAGSHYPIIERIPPNTTGLLVGAGQRVNGTTIWKEISVNGHRGWVSAEHLSLEHLLTDPTVADPVRLKLGNRSRLVYAPQPAYPYTARKNLVTGSGRFKVRFNADGKAELVEVVQSHRQWTSRLEHNRHALSVEGGSWRQMGTCSSNHLHKSDALSQRSPA